MKQRTSLSVLFATLFLWTLSGAVGCDDGGEKNTGGGGTGGTGGVESGGGGTGGTSTGGNGGGGNDTGGNGGGGSGGGGNGGSGGGELATCKPRPPTVLGCVRSESLPEDPALPFVLEDSGIVDAVRAPDAGETCGTSWWYQLGSVDKPEVMIDLILGNGTPLTVGLAVPGFTQSSVVEGETLGVRYSANFAGFGGRMAVLELERDGALVAAVGHNMPAGLTPTQGKAECYVEDQLCGHKDMQMAVSDGEGNTVTIDNGQSAEVGGLMVTNDQYFQNYDTSGGCNFGLSVEYLMSAAAFD